MKLLLFGMIWTSFYKIHNEIDFFIDSLVLIRPDNDKDKQWYIMFHNAKYTLWYIQLSSWLSYLI